MKLHLRTRDGWRKSIENPGVADNLSLPYMHGQVVVGPVDPNVIPSPVMSSISRMDFQVVKTVRITDHRTGATTTEKWLEEV